MDDIKREQLQARARALAQERISRAAKDAIYAKERAEAADKSFRQHWESQTQAVAIQRSTKARLQREQSTANALYEHRALEAIQKHQEVLLRKYAQLAVEDDYGVRDESRWQKEVEYFVDKVLRREIGSTLFGIDVPLLCDMVNLETRKFHVKRKDEFGKRTFTADITPLEYEHFCADLLRDAGWTVNVTKASGDQGVDILGRKDDRSVVFQCKKFSSPVGNAAVQEINAGRAFYVADYAAVVSNQGYTRSATELARSTGVKLLHHDDLRGLTLSAF